MLNKIKNRKQEGFTIIEVLIVLAIAGLIMLIVFLAVPALQRNNANTGRRSEASRIATAANDFATNNNGTLPTAAADGAGDALVIETAVGSLKYLTKVSTTVGAGDGTSATDEANIYVGYKCSGSKATSASARSMAVEFGVENGSATGTLSCINI